jgi:hypothetical protein
MTSITRERLLLGLDGIAASLASRPQALALLALGSCGVEVARLDRFSDLDFFVIVEEPAEVRLFLRTVTRATAVRRWIKMAFFVSLQSFILLN